MLNCSTYKSQHFLSSFVNIFDLDKTQFIIDKKSVILYFNKIARIKMGRIINNLKFTFTFDCACVDDSTLSKNMYWCKHFEVNSWNFLTQGLLVSSAFHTGGKFYIWTMQMQLCIMKVTAWDKHRLHIRSRDILELHEATIILFLHACVTLEKFYTQIYANCI